MNRLTDVLTQKLILDGGGGRLSQPRRPESHGGKGRQGMKFCKTKKSAMSVGGKSRQ